MSTERLKCIKDNLMVAVESQMANLSEVDTEELGDAIDMIKDLEEALYYCTVVKAMEDGEKESRGMYYTPMYHDDYNRMYYRGGGDYAYNRESNSTDGRDHSRISHYDERMYYRSEPMYYTGNGNGSSNGSISGSSSGGMSQYSEREYPYAFEDEREGKSHRYRRMYMEAKETHQDKAAQMKELEKYAQELTTDMIEMIQDASQEERQYLSKKVTALANKIVQLNG